MPPHAQTHNMSSNLDNVRVQELEPRSELRVELIEASLRAVVAPTSAAESDGGGSVAAGVCYFKLISGTAELFGTELAQGKDYKLKAPKSFSIFTWHGCQIAIWGSYDAYVSSETPMLLLANIHAVLDARRSKAAADGTVGPRVIIVGPQDAGKSTISRILLNYSVRRERAALFIDLDVGQGALSVPGSVAAVQVLRPVDVQTDFAEASAPLCHFYGSPSPGDNTKLFKLTVDRLMADVNGRFAKLPEFAAHGFIANTFGWVEGVGLQMITHCMQSLAADVVLVAGDERLFNDLKAKLAGGLGGSGNEGKAPPTVLYVPRSGGVVQRSTAVRRAARTHRIREYFYGPDNLLAPHSTQVLASDVVLLRVGGSPQAPSSALPIGAEHRIDPAELEEVEPDAAIVNSLAAVSFAQTREEVDASAVAGFIFIQEVLGEDAKKRLRIMTPCAGPLPSKFILLSPNIKWQEL